MPYDCFVPDRGSAEAVDVSINAEISGSFMTVDARAYQVSAAKVIG
jgi:hypothetical protein